MKLIGTNLLTTYDKGRFESAAETWPAGFAHIGKTQLDLQAAGVPLSGNFAGSFSLDADDPDVADMNRIVAFSFQVTQKKKYTVRLDAYVPFLFPIADTTAKLLLIPYPYPNVDIVQEFTFNWTQTVGSAIDTVRKMEYKFEAQANQTITFVLAVTTDPTNWDAAGNYNTGNLVFVDQVQIYEYTQQTGDLNPQAPNAIYFFRNPAVFSNDANLANIAKPNYRLYTEVYVEQNYLGNNFEPELTQELPIDNNNQADFYINEAFADMLTPYLPSVGQTFSAQATEGLRRFRIFFGEKWGDEPSVQPLSVTSDMLMMSGGLAKETKLNWWDLYGKNNKKFLTWAPNEALVTEAQENYLYFFLYSAITGFRVRAQIFYTDGTNEIHQLFSWDGSPTLQKGSLFVLPVGYTQASIGLKNVAKTVSSYKVYVEDIEANVISEERTYTIERTGNAALYRYFLFENSLGGYDSLRTKGKSELNARAEYDEIESILPPDYNVQDGQFSRINIAADSNNIDTSTGFIRKEYAEYLRELLYSRRVFETVEGQRVPVIIETKSFSINRTYDYNYYLRFKYRHAYRNEVYTPLNYNDSKIVKQR